PREHECPAVAGSPGQDAGTTRVREGMVLARADLLRFAQLLPPEVWHHRDVFFPEGTRMVISACHRRYPPPRAYRVATQRFAGKPDVDADGNLTLYVAGLPFPPETIDPATANAGARCAWDFELRHRGAE